MVLKLLLLLILAFIDGKVLALSLAAMTTKLYCLDSTLFESPAKLYGMVASAEGEGILKRYSIQLDQTIFHAQGGGQQGDTGVIEFPASGHKFEVASVSIDGPSQVISHVGAFILSEGQQELNLEDLQQADNCVVTLKIDRERRLVATKLHSIGHLLDAAMERIEGSIGEKLIPGKGYHFPDSPYVEYSLAEGAEVTPAEIASLPAQLTAHLAALIAEGIETKISTMTRAEASAVCKKLDLSKYPDVMRVVDLGGVAIPCGGTHVMNTAELGTGWTVKKVSKKKSMYRVPYFQQV